MIITIICFAFVSGLSLGMWLRQTDVKSEERWADYYFKMWMKEIDKNKEDSE
jgi:hypothetical protein